jgi:hypothetical protein
VESGPERLFDHSTAVDLSETVQFHQADENLDFILIDNVRCDVLKGDFNRKVSLENLTPVAFDVGDSLITPPSHRVRKEDLSLLDILLGERIQGSLRNDVDKDTGKAGVEPFVMRRQPQDDEVIVLRVRLLHVG